MPIQIENISDETHQRHIILFEESEIALTLRYYPTVQIWCADVEYKDSAAYGHKLSGGVLHMRSRNFPFDLTVTVENGSGLDPFRADDFLTGRCKLYLLDAADMELIRATPVPL